MFSISCIFQSVKKRGLDFRDEERAEEGFPFGDDDCTFEAGERSRQGWEMR